MFLTRISVRHPVFTIMVMLAIVVLGIKSYSRMVVESYPPINIPFIQVVVNMPGASPNTIEKQITKPLETTLRSLAGLETITSTTMTGRAIVQLQFKLEVDRKQALADVQEKVVGVSRAFPQSAKPPLVDSIDFGDQPVGEILISSSTLTQDQVRDFAENSFSKRLQKIDGVGNFELIGGHIRQIVIEPDLIKLKAYGLSIANIRAVVKANSSDDAVGYLTLPSSSKLVVLRGKQLRVKDLEDLVVSRDGSTFVYLKDVATVRDGSDDSVVVVEADGEPTVSIGINRKAEANIIELVDDIKALVAKENASLKERGINFQFLDYGASNVKTQFNNVKKMLVEGIVLTILIVFLFLQSWRSTVITALTLPISIIGTFVVIYFLGFSLNQLSLLALSLSIGILVDDAIVVRENITRHVKMGKTRLMAALDATSEIGLAVLATTFSIVAVFIPVAFMDGIMGQFFYQFGVTVAVAVLISLFISFTLDPMLSSIWPDRSLEPGYKPGAIGKVASGFNTGFDWLASKYATLITWSLRHRLLTLAITFALLFSSIGLAFHLKNEFIPDETPDHLTYSVVTEPGVPFNTTVEKGNQVRTLLYTLPEVSKVLVVGQENQGRRNNVRVVAILKPAAEIKRTAQEIMADMRAKLTQVVGARVIAQGGGGGAGGGASSSTNISFSVIGIGDDREMKLIGNEIAAALRKTPGVVDLDYDFDDVISSFDIHLKRPLVDSLNITNDELYSALFPLLSGIVLAPWEDKNGESYDIVLRLPKTDRNSLSKLENMRLLGLRDNNNRALDVTLGQIADIVPGSVPFSIARKDQERYINFKLGVDLGYSQQDVIKNIQDKITQMRLPPYIHLDFGSADEELSNLISTGVSTILFIVILLYLVLASQFGSFIQPITIMISLPLSIIGVLVSLYLTKSGINMFSAIGFFTLLGLVTKNSILLVDYSNHLRREGVGLYDSLIEAGKVRFRPIMMTTLAMIFGMLPVSLSILGGGGVLSSMANVIIGGLISSTLLTLVVIPIIVSYFAKFEDFLGRILPFRVDHEGLRALNKKNDKL